MRAMVLAGPGPVEKHPLRPMNVDDPVPEDDELLVSVAVCGVCRTDLHIVEGELADAARPIVPGHQAIGRVSAAGPAVQGYHVGDRIGVSWVNRLCGQCDECISGRENLCTRPTFTGYHRAGGFAELVTVPAAFAHPIPEALGDDAHAAPLLCAGIIGYRALKRSRLRPGARLGLYGFGAAAHIAIQVARAWGCEVFVFSRRAEARRRATAMGASWAGASAQDPPRPLDHAVTFAPAGAVVPHAMRNLRPGGTLAVAGIYLDRVPELEYETHLFHERSITSVTANTRADARELLAIAGQIGIRTDITTFELEQANDALESLKTGWLGAQAAVLHIGS